MTRLFVELPIFRSRWKDLGLNDDDLKRLQEELLADPKIGAVMRGTGGVRKMRFAFEQRGKSGSIRVIYVDFEVYEKIFLITAHKNQDFSGNRITLADGINVPLCNGFAPFVLLAYYFRKQPHFAPT